MKFAALAFLCIQVIGLQVLAEECKIEGSLQIISEYEKVEKSASDLHQKFHQAKNHKELQGKLDSFLRILLSLRDQQKATGNREVDSEIQRQIDALSNARAHLVGGRIPKTEMANLEFSVNGLIDVGARNSNHIREEASMDAGEAHAYCLVLQEGLFPPRFSKIEAFAGVVGRIILSPLTMVPSGKYGMSITRIEQINALAAPTEGGADEKSGAMQ